MSELRRIYMLTCLYLTVDLYSGYLVCIGKLRTTPRYVLVIVIKL